MIVKLIYYAVPNKMFEILVCAGVKTYVSWFNLCIEFFFFNPLVTISKHIYFYENHFPTSKVNTEFFFIHISVMEGEFSPGSAQAQAAYLAAQSKLVGPYTLPGSASASTSITEPPLNPATHRLHR